MALPRQRKPLAEVLVPVIWSNVHPRGHKGRVYRNSGWGSGTCFSLTFAKMTKIGNTPPHMTEKTEVFGFNDSLTDRERRALLVEKIKAAIRSGNDAQLRFFAKQLAGLERKEAATFPR